MGLDIFKFWELEFCTISNLAFCYSFPFEEQKKINAKNFSSVK